METGINKRHHLVTIEENRRKDFRANPVEERQARTVEWPTDRALGNSTIRSMKPSIKWSTAPS